MDEEKGSAKFNRDNKRLVVHLPIKSVGLVLDHTSYEEEGMLHELVAHRNVAMEPQAIDEVGAELQIRMFYTFLNFGNLNRV